ncbi:DUF6625 family protein [Acinetobacter soli]|uniref:DUF6625 family protein n=1 Tax=Acinetobacter soli TaxID=487316 RepID=UPI0032B314FB
MIINSRFKRILVIAVWFGEVPESFNLWLQSCVNNQTIDWLLITDIQFGNRVFEKNIHIRNMTMQEFQKRISDFSNLEIKFEKPYKACDYRPLYSCFIDLVEGCWDYWGHCDIDMVFGDVRKYLTDKVLENNKIFGVGHFSLYKNIPEINLFFKKNNPYFDYKEILENIDNKGFDEHLGINKIFNFYKESFYENEDIIIDVDPYIRNISRMSTNKIVKNYKYQIFIYNNGVVGRYYVEKNCLVFEEFMYMHFQKRKKIINSSLYNFKSFCLTPEGFKPFDPNFVDKDLIATFNPYYYWGGFKEELYRLKRVFRIFRRNLKGSYYE